MSLVSIIIPTFNNREYFEPCITSILTHKTPPGLFKVIVVNNGHKDSVPDRDDDEVKVIQAGKNLGWEGGLKEGLKHVDTPFVVFMNDDTYIPVSSAYWLLNMLENFSDPLVAAVGPSSNVVMGMQNIFIPSNRTQRHEVNYLIGFCVMLRKEYLDKVGGVDDSLPYHGDDLDLSIRFRKAGYKLICDKGIFVYHHGFKTGQREKGSAWNSLEMTEKTNTHLIKKHGLKDFIRYIFNPVDKELGMDGFSAKDTEGQLVRKYAQGRVIELGCGDKKTVEGSEGIDITPKGELIPGLWGRRSIADHCCDIQEKLPLEDNSYDTVIVRHLLEHMINPVKCLKDWRRVIKPGGRLIVAVPDHEIRNTIPMNYQHVRGFTKSSLKDEMIVMGFKSLFIGDSNNGVSFVGVFEKDGYGYESLYDRIE